MFVSPKNTSSDPKSRHVVVGTGSTDTVEASHIQESQCVVSLQMPAGSSECGRDAAQPADVCRELATEDLAIDYWVPSQHQDAWRSLINQYVETEQDLVLQEVKRRSVDQLSQLVFGPIDTETFVTKYETSGVPLKTLRSDLESLTKATLSVPIPSHRWVLFSEVINTLSVRWVELIDKHRSSYGALRLKDAEAGLTPSDVREAQDRFRKELPAAQLLYNIMEVATHGLLTRRAVPKSRKTGFQLDTSSISDKSSDFFTMVMFNFQPSFELPFLAYFFSQRYFHFRRMSWQAVREPKRVVLFSEIDDRRNVAAGESEPFINTVPGPACLEPETAGANLVNARNLRRILQHAGLTTNEMNVIKLRYGLDRHADIAMQGEVGAKKNGSVSCDEVGKAIGLSWQRIRFLEERAMTKMRRFVAGEQRRSARVRAKLNARPYKPGLE